MSSKWSLGYRRRRRRLVGFGRRFGGGCRDGFRRTRNRGRRCAASIWIVEGWIQQHRILAQQTPVGPVQFQEEIEKRFAYRIFRRNGNEIDVRSSIIDGETQLQQHGRPFDAGALEMLRTGDSDRQCVEISSLRTDDLDASLKRFIETRGRL